MSAVLLDVNVLMAIAWPDHEHHAAATRWFLALKQPWASCALTECGFLRLSSNPRITPLAGRPADALMALKSLRSLQGHRFWAQDYSPLEESGFAKLQGHNQITDAYLLLLAHRQKGQLASFDAGLKVLAQEWLGDANRVLLIDSKT